jgi:Ni,Fe-hydrogenase I cytochrome b subunit
MTPLDVFSDVLIVTTYLFFVIRYLKIKRNFSVDLQLKDFLVGILDTLKIYRRMFYLAIIILLINMIVSFAAGLYLGVKYSLGNIPGGMENLSLSKIILIIGIGLVFLIPLITGTFLVLRWGFNKLYGRYLVKLNETLTELDETVAKNNEQV